MYIEESGGRRDKEGGALEHAKRREGYLSPLEQSMSSSPDSPEVAPRQLGTKSF